MPRTVFPAHQVTGGLVLLAELSDEQLDTLYATERYIERPANARTCPHCARTWTSSGARASRSSTDAGVTVIEPRW